MSVVRLRYRPAAVQPELAVVKGENDFCILIFLSLIG